MKDNSEKIIVVGAGPQALFLVRELSRLNCHVILLGRRNEIAMHSRYAEKINIRSEEHLILELTSLANTNPKLKLYVASGFYLSFLIRHFPRLFQLFQVIPAHKNSVEILITKTETYRLAKMVNVRYPKSHLLVEFLGNNHFDTLVYPLIAKWNRDIYLFGKPDFKTKIIESEKELKKLIASVNDLERRSIIVQEYLGSDLRNNFSYGAYLEDGVVKLDICVNEVRHYRSGVSSVVEEYTGAYADEISAQAEKLLQQTQFTGFLDVEFKIREGKLYLLEVNPRPFGFIRIMKKKYPDLVAYAMGYKREINKNPKSVKWINLLRDMVLLFKNPKAVFHMLQLVFDFERRTFDVWDIYDPLPFFYQMKR